jgi:hypothetical protein
MPGMDPSFACAMNVNAATTAATVNRAAATLPGRVDLRGAG